MRAEQPHERHSLHDAAFPPTRGLAWILRFLHFSNHLIKGFGYIGIQASAGLCEAALELLSQLAAIFCRDLSLVKPEIAFVSNNHYRHPIGTLG